MALSKSLRLVTAPRSGIFSAARRSCLAGNTNANANANRNYQHVNNVRNASTKGKSGSGSGSGSPSGIDKAPEMNFDHTKGNPVLKEKAKRAAELHAELNQLLDKQAQRRADEMNRPPGAGFIEFMKKSKSEMINIFASFCCVCLAYQIYGIRKGARTLLEDAEENNKKMEEYKDMMRLISSKEFQSNVSKLYTYEMKKRAETHNNSNNVTGGSGWFGRRAAAVGDASKRDSSGNHNEDILSTILQRELAKVIGDVALTDSEIQEKKLAELQREMGIVKEKKASSPSPDADTLGGLEQIIVESQNDGPSTNRKVLKRTGFI